MTHASARDPRGRIARSDAMVHAHGPQPVTVDTTEEAPREHIRLADARTSAARPYPTTTGPILEVEDLNVSFYVDGEWFPAAIDISYDVDRGEVLAIVGESGSGKTQSSMSLLGLLPANGRSSGSAKLNGKELVGLTGAACAGSAARRSR